jgi:hypothetical protein
VQELLPNMHLEIARISICVSQMTERSIVNELPFIVKTRKLGDISPIHPSRYVCVFLVQWMNRYLTGKNR